MLAGMRALLEEVVRQEAAKAEQAPLWSAWQRMHWTVMDVKLMRRKREEWSRAKMMQGMYGILSLDVLLPRDR